MSYTLEIDFKPAVAPQRISAYFAAREHFKMVGNQASYGNERTGVNFWFTFRFRRDLLFRKVIKSAEFEVNFFRPSFFGLEAEIELSAFVAMFRPRIFDPQIDGMRTGPYSGEGFLRGWNFGNAFAARDIPPEGSDHTDCAMPESALRAAWEWNYRIPKRVRQVKDRQFVPMIKFFRMNGRPATIAVWPLGMPISLPKVDYVLIGQSDDGEKRFGLAPWPEVLDLARSAGFDVSGTTLELAYRQTPEPIAKWFQDIPLIDLKSFEFLEVHKLLDDETIERGAALELVREQIVGDK